MGKYGHIKLIVVAYSVVIFLGAANVCIILDVLTNLELVLHGT